MFCGFFILVGCDKIFNDLWDDKYNKINNKLI